MRLLVFFFILIGLSSCKNRKKAIPNILKDDSLITKVGDIEYDPQVDGDFTLCYSENAVLQYYAFDEKPFKFEKKHAINFFKNKFNAEVSPKESGLLRIRFIVNCRGEIGRLRISAMDWNYNPFEFSEKISEALLELVKEYDGFSALKRKNQPRDYYFYLIFKLEDGVLQELMP